MLFDNQLGFYNTEYELYMFEYSNSESIFPTYYKIFSAPLDI